MMRLGVLALIGLTLSGAAFAAAGEPIDMSTVLRDDKGVVMPDPFEATKDDPSCTRCPNLTLGLAAAHALVAMQPEEKDLDPLQKWARGALAVKLREGKPVALSAEEIAVLKRLMGKVYGPIVIMQAFPLLDSAAAAPGVK